MRVPGFVWNNIFACDATQLWLWRPIDAIAEWTLTATKKFFYRAAKHEIHLA